MGALIGMGLMAVTVRVLWVLGFYSVAAANAIGLAFAPTPTLKVFATIGVVGFAVVILLAILPGPRRTYT